MRMTRGESIGGDTSALVIPISHGRLGTSCHTRTDASPRRPATPSPPPVWSWWRSGSPADEACDGGSQVYWIDGLRQVEIESGQDGPGTTLGCPVGRDRDDGHVDAPLGEDGP